MLVSILYMAGFPYLAHKYRQGLNQRRALYSDEFIQSVKDKKPLWVHSVSVGEVQSAMAFIREAVRVNFRGRVVFSTTTTTGRLMAERILGNMQVHNFYYPWDIPWIVKRSLDSINPSAYVVMETELWPSMLYELKRREIPLFLVNGRFSDKSFEKKLKKPFFWCELLSLFNLIMVREAEDRDRLLSIGIPEDKVVVTGDCKVDALIQRYRNLDLSRIRSLVGTEKPVFIAGSTHPGEDATVLEAFRIIHRTERSARLILVPRHPDRAQPLKDEIGSQERAVMFSELSKKNNPDKVDWDVLVVDKIGFLFELYGVADGAFVGGSLVPKGGQNILEPAIFGIPIAHGPHMEDFREASRELKSLGVASVVTTSSELADHWRNALDKDMKKNINEKSAQYFLRSSGASGRSWELVKEHISSSGGIIR